MKRRSRLPSERRPLIALLFVFLVLLAARVLSCPDLGWHLRAGERIVEERAIPATDTFTYTAAGNPWRVNQPLAEVLFYAVNRGFGPAGLILLRVGVVLLAFLFVLRASRLSEERNELVAAGILLLAMLACSSHMLLRPNTISAMLLAVAAWSVEKMRRGRPVRFWFLPFLFAVWAEVHPGFLFGAGLLACTVAGEAVRRKVPLLRGDLPVLDRRALTRLALVSVLAVGAAVGLAALVNPSRAAAPLLPIGLLRSEYFFGVLDEFRPASLSRDWFFAVLFLLAILSTIPRKRRDATEILQLLLFGLFAARAVRLIQPFAILAAPIAIRNLAPLANRIAPDASQAGRLGRALLAAGILWLGVWWWKNDPLRIPVPPEWSMRRDTWAWGSANYPIRAFRFLDREKLPGEVFHPDRYGGPFIWYFHPKRKNFIDGRVEVFGEEFWKNTYARIVARGPGWEQLLARYRVNTLLLAIDPRGGADPLSLAAPAHPEWALVYFDDEAMILVRRNAMRPEDRDRLVLEGVDPRAGSSPRTYEEEILARAGLRRCREAGRSQRALLHEWELLALRGGWSAIASTGDEWLAVRGQRGLRYALHLLRGESRFRAGDWEGARGDWEKAGETPRAHLNRLLIKYVEEGGIERLVESGGEDPPGALARLADLLRDAGDFAAAADLLREAVRIGGRPEHRNELAWTLLDGGGDAFEALREARSGVRALPDDAYARGTLARALERAGDLEGAERELREAIRLLPSDDYRTRASMRGRLALLLSLGTASPERRAEALAAAAEALRDDFEADAKEDLLRLLARGGRAEEIARLALREGEIRNRASRKEGGPVLADRGRYIYMEILRDLGLDYDEIRRLADRHTPRTKDDAQKGRNLR